MHQIIFKTRNVGELRVGVRTILQCISK